MLRAQHLRCNRSSSNVDGGNYVYRLAFACDWLPRFRLRRAETWRFPEPDHNQLQYDCRELAEDPPNARLAHSAYATRRCGAGI